VILTSASATVLRRQGREERAKAASEDLKKRRSERQQKVSKYSPATAVLGEVLLGSRAEVGPVSTVSKLAFYSFTHTGLTGALSIDRLLAD